MADLSVCNLVILTGEQANSTGFRGKRAQAFDIWFGAYASSHVIVYARNFEDAAEQAAQWASEAWPGLFESEADMKRHWNEAASELELDADTTDDDERARIYELAEQDLTYFDPCIYVCSHEWGGGEINRDDIKAMIADETARGYSVHVD